MANLLQRTNIYIQHFPYGYNGNLDNNFEIWMKVSKNNIYLLDPVYILWCHECKKNPYALISAYLWFLFFTEEGNYKQMTIVIYKKLWKVLSKFLCMKYLCSVSRIKSSLKEKYEATEAFGSSNLYSVIYEFLTYFIIQGAKSILSVGTFIFTRI